MGTDVPTEPFVIDPATSYLVTVDCWVPAPLPPQCGGTYMGQLSDTILGADIIAWIDAGKECTLDILIGPPLAGYTNRIFSIEEV